MENRTEDDLIELGGETSFYLRNLSSPLPEITLHKKYDASNEMYVVCG